MMGLRGSLVALGLSLALVSCSGVGPEVRGTDGVNVVAAPEGEAPMGGPRLARRVPAGAPVVVFWANYAAFLSASGQEAVWGRYPEIMRKVRAELEESFFFDPMDLPWLEEAGLEVDGPLALAWLDARAPAFAILMEVRDETRLLAKAKALGESGTVRWEVTQQGDCQLFSAQVRSNTPGMTLVVGAEVAMLVFADAPKMAGALAMLQARDSLAASAAFIDAAEAVLGGGRDAANFFYVAPSFLARVLIAEIDKEIQGIDQGTRLRKTEWEQDWDRRRRRELESERAAVQAWLGPVDYVAASWEVDGPVLRWDGRIRAAADAALRRLFREGALSPAMAKLMAAPDVLLFGRLDLATALHAAGVLAETAPEALFAELDHLMASAFELTFSGDILPLLDGDISLSLRFAEDLFAELAEKAGSVRMTLGVGVKDPEQMRLHLQSFFDWTPLRLFAREHADGRGWRVVLPVPMWGEAVLMAAPIDVFLWENTLVVSTDPEAIQVAAGQAGGDGVARFDGLSASALLHMNWSWTALFALHSGYDWDADPYDSWPDLPHSPEAAEAKAAYVALVREARQASQAQREIEVREMARMVRLLGPLTIVLDVQPEVLSFSWQQHLGDSSLGEALAGIIDAIEATQKASREKQDVWQQHWPAISAASELYQQVRMRDAGF